MNKLTSRKFWICFAAMLASIATSISALQTGNQTAITIGMICTVASGAIYAFCEAWVDGMAAQKPDTDMWQDSEVSHDVPDEYIQPPQEIEVKPIEHTIKIVWGDEEHPEPEDFDVQ